MRTRGSRRSSRGRGWVKGLIVGLFTGVAGALLGLSPLGSTFERSVGLHWLFNMRGVIEPPPDVVVVAIDGRTGDQLGLPPLPREWPRTIHGQLVDTLVQKGASVIVFDVHFHKPKSPEHDQGFVNAVDRAERVVLVEQVNGKRQPIADQNGVFSGMVWIEELLQPFPELADVARGLGTFTLPKLEASVYEFWVFKDSVGDAPTMPAVALQIHGLQDFAPWQHVIGQQLQYSEQTVLPQSAADISNAQQLREYMLAIRDVFKDGQSGDFDLESLLRRSERLDLDPKARRRLEALVNVYAGNPHRYLNYYGPPGTITTVPYHAVIKGGDPNVPESALDFADKIVFVGFSDLYDPGQPDRFYTVYTREDGVDLSGVEIAATAFSNLLTSRSLQQANRWTSLGMLFGFGLVIGTLVYLLPAIIGVPVAIALAALYAVIAQFSFNTMDYWMPLTTPMLVQFPVALFLGLLGQYLLERRKLQHVSEAINYYLPDNVVLDLTENRLDPSAINKVVYSTCLATDMAGFSTIAETLNPGELANFLNDYFDTLAKPLKQYHVDVTEFRADAIMCAWTSASGPNTEVRRKAVLASLQAADAIDEFKKRCATYESSLRIGLEVGTVYVGHAGGGGHFVFSIVGDCANTASRIEGLNKHIGTQILATSAVVEDVEDLLLRPLGGFVFVGKTEPLPIVEILSTRSSARVEQVQLCERFAEGLEAFHNGQWPKATQRFESILMDYPTDGPSRFLLGRCAQYRAGQSVPEDPGVIRMAAK
ncbi:MAG: adenylate/guanylate cyclase domain-containing protein [Gammaproteobacteria bacterium]|nr:adenylate/guanylate cyclase domain-containing protein [Gammaproteobacteria bacterium]